MPMLKARDHFCIINFQETIFALGGHNRFGTLNSVEYYDKENNLWEATTPMLNRRRNLSAAVYQNKIFAIGGKDENKIDLNSVECFDPTNETWSQVKEINKSCASNGQ